VVHSFIPLIANFLAEDVGKASGLTRDEIQGLKVNGPSLSSSRKPVTCVR
jgi:hypothetical protein